MSEEVFDKMEEFDPSEAYSVDNKDDGDIFDDYQDTSDYLDEVSDEELQNSIFRQNSIFEKHLKQMREMQEKYQEKAEEAEALKNEKRGFFELNLNKSNLKGDTIFERLGYDKDVKNKPYEETHKLENWIDTHITNPKLRIGLYGGFCILCLILIILSFFLK